MEIISVLLEITPKPSHEGYRNTIELPIGNNVVPLQSDTIQLVQNGCSFQGLRERTHLHLFQFSLRDQASNWLERLPTGSISTWEDLTTRFLAQFFPPRRTDVLSTSVCHLIELKNQVQRLMEAHLAPKKHVQVNKISSLCEICSGPHDTQYCMENLEQAFVDYASSRLVSNFMASQDARSSKFEADFKQQQSEMTNKIDTVLKAITDRITGALPSDTVKNPKLNINPISLVLSACSYPTEDPQCSSHPVNSINAIKTYGIKSYPIRIVRDIEVHIGKLKLLNDFYVIDMKNDPETPLLVGRGFLATTNAVIDCRKTKIAVEEGITRLMRRNPEVLRKFQEDDSWMMI
ncbi:MAK10-like protein [Tanacetum coccineum]